MQKNRHIKLAGNDKLRIERDVARSDAIARSSCATCCARSARRRRPLRHDCAEFAPGLFIRGFTPPLRCRDFKLVAFDMDSTLINIECVDEIADAAGRKAEVAAITEAAMRGEIADYKDSLRRRVALLDGVPESALQTCTRTACS